MNHLRMVLSCCLLLTLMGIKEGTTVMDAKWLGPCKPGQTPGDIIVPEIERMKKMRQGGAGNP